MLTCLAASDRHDLLVEQRKLRVLQLRSSPAAAADRAVLDEAYALGWYQALGLNDRSELDGLFPNPRGSTRPAAGLPVAPMGIGGSDAPVAPRDDGAAAMPGT